MFFSIGNDEYTNYYEKIKENFCAEFCNVKNAKIKIIKEEFMENKDLKNKYLLVEYKEILENSVHGDDDGSYNLTSCDLDLMKFEKIKNEISDKYKDIGVKYNVVLMASL
jgi:hypothetical protein